MEAGCVASRWTKLKWIPTLQDQCLITLNRSTYPRTMGTSWSRITFRQWWKTRSRPPHQFLSLTVLSQLIHTALRISTSQWRGKMLRHWHRTTTDPPLVTATFQTNLTLLPTTFWNTWSKRIRGPSPKAATTTKCTCNYRQDTNQQLKTVQSPLTKC